MKIESLRSRVTPKGTRHERLEANEGQTHALKVNTGLNRATTSTIPASTCTS
ncbi:MAG: hypothetical protein ACHBN1_28990 [Heteroscytonema crispum UTEX LB 1556]